MFLVIIVLFLCFSNSQGQHVLLTSSQREKLSSAKKFDDIFKKVSEVQLATGPDCLISLITDMAIDKNGNFIIADGWQSKAVFIFGPDGNFIRELGRQGQGPGEYTAPVCLDIGRNGDIYVVDYLNNRMNVYDENFDIKTTIVPRQSRIKHFIRLNSRDEIYMFSGANRLLFGATQVFDTISKFDRQGNLIGSFAPFPKEVANVKFFSGENGMTIGDDDFIYEMNPLYYNVRKFSSEGKLIKSFTRKTSLFEIITDETKSPIIVYGPYYLKKGLILVKVSNHLEIFDTEGNFIVGKLPFSKKILGTKDNSIYVEQLPEDDVQPELLNPKLICFQLL